MNIDLISIKGMYGSYSRVLNFREDINLLIGINGSGKTTLLNCIDWMLRPDFASLAATSFEEISVDFSWKGEDYTLVATQSESQMVVRETKTKNFPHPITVDFVQHPSEITYEREYQSAREQYRRLGPEKSERKLWSFLAGLDSPLIVSLDRSISAEVEDEIFIDSGTMQRVVRGKKQKSPGATRVLRTRNLRHIP